MKISDQDRRILDVLQRDCSRALAGLSDELSIPQSTLWRRLNDLDTAGVIRARVALVDAAKVGAKLCVLAMVSLEDHSEEAVTAFAQMVAAHPEIMECHKISGGADYVLKIRARDVEAYEDFQTRFLLRNKWVRSVQSSFVLKEVKATTAVPI